MSLIVLPPYRNSVALTDSYPDKVVLKLSMHGNVGDSSFVNEANGAPVQSSNCSLTNSTFHTGPTSLALNASSSVLVSSADLSYDGDFTEELFVNLSAHNAVLMDTYLGRTVGRQLHVQPNGIVVWYYSGLSRLGGVGLALNTWHHLATTRKGDRISLWVNGKRTDSLTGMTGIMPAGLPQLCLNYQQGSGPVVQAVGFMELVRITKGICRYDEDFVVPNSY